MNKLLAVLPVSKVDYDLALSLIRWMCELGEFLSETFLLVCDENLSKQQRQNIYCELCYLSDEPDAIVSRHFQKEDCWPISCNSLWLNAARHVEANQKVPWLWLEADCVPLKTGWLGALEDEYSNCGKPFMGTILPETEVFGKTWPSHLNGVAVYPHDAASRLASLNLENAKEAWDILAGHLTVPHAHHTKLLAHTWGENKLPPTFVEAREKGCAKNVLTLDQIPKSAVLFHRCKDDSLRNLLRQRGVAKSACLTSR